MEFKERLKMAMVGESVRSFAHRAGISATVLHKYLSGISEPTRTVLIALSKGAGVSAGWLAFGEEALPQKPVEDTVQAQATQADSPSPRTQSLRSFRVTMTLPVDELSVGLRRELAAYLLADCEHTSPEQDGVSRPCREPGDED